MNRLTRDGTAEPVSRDQILRHVRGQGNIHSPCSADHEQDWQPYPVHPYSAICDDHQTPFIIGTMGSMLNSSCDQGLDFDISLLCENSVNQIDKNYCAMQVNFIH